MTYDSPSPTSTFVFPGSSNKRQYPSDRFLSSWTQASELCKKAGAYLPYFTNREDLEELLAMLKLSQDMPPIEAIFIGLRFNGSGMVGHWQKQIIARNYRKTSVNGV